MKKLFEKLSVALTILSFLMIIASFGYILYFLVCFNFYKALIGCVVMYIMIHLNKSL